MRHFVYRRFAWLLLMLLSLAGTASAVEPPRGYDVLDYDASLYLEPEEKWFQGRVTIRLVALAERLDTVQFDAGALILDVIVIDNAPAGGRRDGTYLNVALPKTLLRGEEKEITLRYSGKESPGLRISQDEIITGFNTSHWLICNDDPADRATLSLSLTFPSHLIPAAVGSPMPSRSAGAEATDWIEQRWRSDTPYPPYLYGFAAGVYTERRETVGIVSFRFLSPPSYTPDELSRIFTSTVPAVKFFQERSGLGLPENRYTQVLARGNIQQEKAGLALIRESYGKEVLEEPREDWLVAHELAHQWWGNLVTCASWSEMWLNEGMATFMTAAFKEQRWGRDEYERELCMARLRYERERREGRDRPLVPVDGISAKDDNRTLTYYKGALVLHLLRNLLEDKKFWNAIRLYTTDNAGRSVTSDDLRHALESASGMNLKELFDMWVHDTVTPQLQCTHTVQGEEVVVVLKQQGEPWQMPLQIAIETSAGRETRRVALSGNRIEYRFPLAGELHSVRIDDGGNLPVFVKHERPVPMLLHQIIHEPDVIGRVDALRVLESRVQTVAVAEREQIMNALRDRATSDNSRLMRQMAGAAVKRLTGQ